MTNGSLSWSEWNQLGDHDWNVNHFEGSFRSSFFQEVLPEKITKLAPEEQELAEIIGSVFLHISPWSVISYAESIFPQRSLGKHPLIGSLVSLCLPVGKGNLDIKIPFNCSPSVFSMILTFLEIEHDRINANSPSKTKTIFILINESRTLSDDLRVSYRDGFETAYRATYSAKKIRDRSKKITRKTKKKLSFDTGSSSVSSVRLRNAQSTVATL